MKLFFLLVEAFILIWMPISILRKKDLSIVYVPLFYFVYIVIDSVFPKGLFIVLMVCLMGYYVLYNLPFVLKNPFSILLVIYFFILAMDLADFRAERKEFLGTISLFLFIGLIPTLYKKYTRQEIYKELSLSAFIFLIIFVSNAFFSTVFKFNPKEMYGISSGVFFGNIVFAAFNFLPLVCFVVFQKAIFEKNKVYFLIGMVAVFLTLLSLRRSVMLLTVIGIFILLIALVERKNLKKLMGLIFGISIATLVVFYSTGFLDMLKERYELRQLDERNLEEEQRVQEITMVYKDLFVYYDYSPWFGYGLFDASGNYGKGQFGIRNLHTDPTVLIHASGFLGLFLYLAMVLSVFWNVWRSTTLKFDYLQFLFISLLFSVYFITGRYTNIPTTLLIHLILCLPIARKIE